MVRTSRAIAELQDRDIERVVKRSGLLASRLWRVAAARVRESNSEISLEPVAEELTDLMVYTYLNRMRLSKRRRSQSKQGAIELSYASDKARKLAKQFEINLGNLRDKFRKLVNTTVRKIDRDIRATINKALSDATYKAMSRVQGVRHVLNKLRKHGIEPKNSSYVETLVRTHATIAYGIAHRQAFMGDPDLWGFELVTMRDNRVRDSHRAVDAVKRKKDDAFWDIWWPPNGWNCRCQAVALYGKGHRQTPVPQGVYPDEGFDTDFSYLLE